MGDPKKHRKKYQTPSHPWQRTRIDVERVYFKDYGLKNKKEIWKMDSLLKGFKHQVKKLLTQTSAQAEKERLQLMARLRKLGLGSDTTQLSDVLGLSVKEVMERRLQTMVVRKNLARSMEQSRQFIVHRHILVNGKKVTVPSYIVKKDEEHTLAFSPSSKLSSPEHPERAVVPKPKKPAPQRKERSFRDSRKG